jgi:5-carboxymethyl-2-hydroxymuconate isomerase
MPMIHLEYSNNLAPYVDTHVLLKSIHVGITERAKAALYNCKSRVTVHNNFLIGDGSTKNAFVSLTVELIAGRSPETKEVLGKWLLEELQSAFSSAPQTLDLQFGCHIADYQNYFRVNR